MSDFNLEHFGSRLAACRNAMDIKQADFSQKLRCTNGAYSLYERGKRRPPLEMLDILCQDFGLSLDHLVSCMTPYEQVFQERLVSTMNHNTDKPLETLLEDIGVNKRAASIFTSGAGFPNAKVLKKICLYYDCSLEYLIGLSDTPTIPSKATEKKLSTDGLLNSTRPRTELDDLVPPYLDEALSYIEYQRQKQTAAFAKIKNEAK